MHAVFLNLCDITDSMADIQAYNNTLMKDKYNMCEHSVSFQDTNKAHRQTNLVSDSHPQLLLLLHLNQVSIRAASMNGVGCVRTLIRA